MKQGQLGDLLLIFFLALSLPRHPPLNHVLQPLCFILDLDQQGDIAKIVDSARFTVEIRRTLDTIGCLGLAADDALLGHKKDISEGGKVGMMIAYSGPSKGRLL